LDVNRPIVSVIIPSYNHERFVEQAIMSVIDQTYKNFELIIIDDGSKDKSPHLIKTLINKFDSSNIIFETQENMGLSKTLNKGIRMANGEFIGFLASDDVYLPNMIEECVNVLSTEKANVCAVYSDGFIIDGDGRKICKHSEKFKIPLGKNAYKELLLRNWIGAGGVLYRKSSLIECGLFDENIEIEDYDLFLRLTKIFQIKYIPKLLFLYRRHSLNYSSDEKRVAEQTKLLAKKHKDLNSYLKYRSALKSKNFIELFHECNFLNIELTFRALIKKAQKVSDLRKNEINYF
jgi:alpha-1,3-rhamnosyltransferase